MFFSSARATIVRQQGWMCLWHRRGKGQHERRHR